MELETLLLELKYLKKEQENLRNEFEIYKQNTDCKIEKFEEKLIDLERKLSLIENTTNTILSINREQTRHLTAIVDKLINNNTSNLDFLKKLGTKQYLIIGSLITFIIVLIKFFIGI